MGSEPLSLAYQTQQAQIDRILEGTVGVFEAVFPGRVRAYYLVGSQVDGSAVSLSDIDARVIFKDRFTGLEEKDKFLRVREYLRSISPVGIDCPPLDEDRLKNDENWVHETLSIKSASQFLFGEDIREGLPTPSFDLYLRDILQAPVLFMSRLHGQDPLLCPVDYPDPEGEFYGYDTLDPENRMHSLKMLVHVAGFIASCRLGLETGQMVIRKSDWLPLYQQSIHDRWLPFLEQVWGSCKEKWAYRIPEDPEDRRTLRALCQQFRDFENDYLNRRGTH